MNLKKISAIALVSILLSSGTISFANENSNNTDLNSEAKQEVVVKDGWKQEGNNWYYYKNGNMTKAQWLKENGKWYYLGENGVMVNTYLHCPDGKTYVFNKESGAMMENRWFIKKEGPWAYVNADGTMKKYEWLKENGKWYFFGYDGSMVADDAYKVGSKVYFFDKNGVMTNKKGWVEGRYGWYYGNGDGTVKTEKWLKEKGKWYYLWGDGRMATDQATYIINKKIYRFDKSGALIDKKGWVKVQGNFWYYGNGDGTLKYDEWVKEKGKWYYLSGDGWMVKDSSWKINGTIYKFDKSGVCLNP